MVDKFRGRKICEKERKNANVVVELLKAALTQKRECWILCLDNADNSDLGGL